MTNMTERHTTPRATTRHVCKCVLVLLLAVGTSPVAARAQGVTTSWTPAPTTFADTVHWDTQVVRGNRQMSTTIYHTDPNHPCTPIYSIAITDSDYARGAAAHKWLSASGACNFGSSGIASGNFYVLASMDLVSKCQGHTGPLSYTHKLWMSLFSTQSSSPSQITQQLTQEGAYPFISNIDGYKPVTIMVNLTCIGPPPPPPPVFTITSATVKPVAYRGACPANVPFTASFATNGLTGGVAVRFEFSDGATSPTTLYHSSGAGVAVNYTRSFTGATSGQVRANGSGVVSPFVSYSVTCITPTQAVPLQRPIPAPVQRVPIKPGR